MENPAITFCVTRMNTARTEFDYTIVISRKDGRSESHGTARVGEVLQISKEELNGDEEVIPCDHQCTSNCRRVGCNCECGEFHKLIET